MMDKLRSWLPLLPLILLLAATYWLNLQVQEPQSGNGKTLRHDPDYLIDNFTATTLDEHGKIRFVMSAQRMLHYPDDDTTHVEAPKVISYSPEFPPTRIQADKGEISRKGDEIFLRNDVSILRAATGNRGELRIHTDSLRILPNKNIADSSSEITLEDARTRMSATGMELDYKSQIVKFLSRVKANYEPPKK